MLTSSLLRLLRPLHLNATASPSYFSELHLQLLYKSINPKSPAELEAALRRLYGDAALRARISERARAFWAVHFGGFVEVGRRLACGLAAKQRALNFTELLSGSGARARVAPTGGRYGGATIDFSEFARRGGIG